jgi:L,D-peptidoglycan transpeptidase YkuD (ErfK/YbiS/YcfS/YnhG family)
MAGNIGSVAIAGCKERDKGVLSPSMSTRAPPTPPQLIVRRLRASATRGTLQCGHWRLPCALGRSGIAARKREGDGATPLGRFAIREVLYNPKFVRRPLTALPLRSISKSDGWCDAPSDRSYNRLVPLPYPASTEQLWRDDGLYDLVVVLDYNIQPRTRNLGSAIFLHVARPGFAPTEGCIALRRADLIRVLSRMRCGTRLITSP